MKKHHRRRVRGSRARVRRGAARPGEGRRRRDRSVRSRGRLAAELLRRRPRHRLDRRHLGGEPRSRLHLQPRLPAGAEGRARRRRQLHPGAQRLGLRHVAEGSGPASALGPRLQRRRPQRQADRVVGPAQQDVRAAAPRAGQPLRRREARLAGRRRRPRHLQVHPRRQEAGDDGGHADAARQRRHALQPPDRHRLAARRHLLRQRRLRQHARRQVRQERQVPADLGREGQRAERDPARLHEHRARHRHRQEPPHLHQRPRQLAHPGLRRERQVPRRVAQRPPALLAAAVRGSAPVGGRRHHPEVHQVRPERQAALLVGHLRRVPRRLLGRAPVPHRQRGQPLHRRRARRPAAEVPPEEGRQPGAT